MSFEIVTATCGEPELWQSIHAVSGIPSHGLGYNLALRATGIEPRLALASGGGHRLVIPFFERQWSGTSDIATVISISGACMNTAAPALIEAWTRHAAEMRWVAGYLQFGPESDVRGIAGMTPGNHVFLIDIGDGGWLQAASTIVRRKIRQAEREGAVLVTGVEELIAPLERLYAETMRRGGARAIYDLPRETLAQWSSDPGNLLVGAALNGVVESAALFLVTGARAEFQIGASSLAGRAISAFVMAKGIEFLRERGVTVLNLGGGVRTGDGLHDFKAKFGGRELPLHALRQIYRPGVYESLCVEAGAAAGEKWFPAYRARAANTFLEEK